MKLKSRPVGSYDDDYFRVKFYLEDDEGNEIKSGYDIDFLKIRSKPRKRTIYTDHQKHKDRKSCGCVFVYESKNPKNLNKSYRLNYEKSDCIQDMYVQVIYVDHPHESGEAFIAMSNHLDDGGVIDPRFP